MSPSDPQFELGASLKEWLGTVKLNRAHCGMFCVLGGDFRVLVTPMTEK